MLRRACGYAYASAGVILAASVVLAACGTVLGYKDIAYSDASDDGGDFDGATAETGSEDGSGGSDGAADSACGDVRSDPLHCGLCGHSCLGGTCSDGGCEPFVLVADAPVPHALAMGDDDLYYAVTVPDAGDHAERVPKSGGAPTRVTVDEPLIIQIALETPYVYYSGDSVKRRRADLTTPAEYVFPEDVRFKLGAFAIWGLDVWAGRPEPGYPVFFTPKEPGPIHSAQGYGPAVATPTTITVSRAGLFVGDSETPASGTAFVRRYSPPNFVEVADRAMIHSAADDEHLWFTQRDDLSVKRMSLDAPPLGTTDAAYPVEDLPPGAGPAGELFVDETHAYWLTVEASGYLHRMAKPNGPVETLVKDVRRGAGLAGDATRVCFGEVDLGRIRCIAK